MLMTKIKSRDELLNIAAGKVFLLTCYGCKEVSIAQAEEEAAQAIDEILASCQVVGHLSANYVCNPEYMKARLEKYAAQIDQADVILVFSCGVGVQTMASLYPQKKVCAACDTYPLPGFQGVTPLEHDCGQCGQCYLNLTGGICPITACSKSLVNGQCGGAKNGKCEVDPNMDCGWERIIRRLTQIGRLDVLKCPVQLRNYATDDDVKVKE